MSAYMVERDHVKYLTDAARQYRVLSIMDSFGNDDAQAARFAQLLWDENRKSILYRYPDCNEDGAHLPGSIEDDDNGFIFGDWPHGMPPRLDPVQVIKACDCYAYQSCEHPGWESSHAKKMVDSIASAACSHLPGYDDAAWGAPREAVAS